MSRALIVAGLLVLSVGVGPAAAQDASRVGLVMGYPASIGLLWQASDRVAIRPEVTFSTTSGETAGTSGTTTAENDSWSTSVGVSALFYLGQNDGGLRTYVSPKFLYGRSSSTTTQQLSANESYRGESTANVYTVAGSFGAEYALGKRFAVFGELGLSYGHSSSNGTQQLPAGSSSRGESTSNGFGTRTALGVVLFF